MENCLYIYIYVYIYVCMFGTYGFRIYIHPAPFVRDAIFPYCMLVHVSHCCSRDKTSRTERLNSGNQRNRNLKTGEEREALLPRWRLIIDMLRDTAANGECWLSVLKTERLACAPEPERSV